MLCIDLKMPIYLTIGKLCPLQKVKFLVPKISVGENAHDKKRAMVKKENWYKFVDYK